jgi:eukaryotic-like serine/threonine-protein kinase
VAGTEPTMRTCTEPTSYQQLVVPSVIGLTKDAAIGALRNAGFNVAVRYEASDEPPDTVLSQDPAGGASLEQTGTVTITVAKSH